MKKNLSIILLIIFGFNNYLLSQNKDITIDYKVNPDNSVDFYYKKKIPGSFLINLEFSSLQNANQSNYKGVIKNSSGSLFKLRPLNNKKGIQFSYKFYYKRGIPNPKVDSIFTYNLPFKKGNKINIKESIHLGKTYFGSEAPINWKSYIVDRAHKDTIYCMRKGIVVEIVNKYKRDSLVQYNYTSNMNKIIVEHKDGTFALYKGFKKDAFLVKLGQTVYPQTQLGILDRFDETYYRLYFDVYYLIDENIKFKVNRTLKKPKNSNKYIAPYFSTKQGTIKLKDRQDYIVDFNETMLFEELTKREKKKYKKNPELFD